MAHDQAVLHRGQTIEIVDQLSVGQPAETPEVGDLRVDALQQCRHAADVDHQLPEARRPSRSRANRSSWMAKSWKLRVVTLT
jgi:hypothetical protein